MLRLSSSGRLELCRHASRHIAAVSDTLLQRQRSYSTTSVLYEENAAVSKTDDAEIKLKNKLAARDFNNRRAAYNRQVSKLRREYAEEVARNRAIDQAEKEALQRELTRKRLERQRRKNIRSAQNALKQKELREKRAREFQEHLDRQQQIRDAKKERYRMARQMVVEELEEEAPLWMTTHEEVEASFTPEAEQLLWARPGGVLGAPNPSLDCSFWQYETHTWHMDRIYKSQRQILLEDVEEMAYEEANIDKSFWTAERLEEQSQVEEKARLRAMVQSAGRTELLRKQYQMMQEYFATEEGEVPRPMPAPSHKMLANETALEREGAKLLMEDPTKFFVFENSTIEGQGYEDNDPEEESESYVGPTLGAPVALRDPLREGSHDGRVFPIGIGKYPKPDMRTEREKKQQEREERMWAAAEAEKMETMDVELAAEDQTAEDLEPPLNYDEQEWDSDEEEWNQGLDPEGDKDILNTPRERRYKEEDIDWVLDTLEGRVRHLEQQFTQDVESLKQSAQAEMQGQSEESGVDDGLEVEAALLSLSETELSALAELDDRYTSGMSPEEFAESIKDIPGLTEDQIKMILERDRDA